MPAAQPRRPPRSRCITAVLEPKDLARAIDELVAEGFEPPLYVAIISNRGEMGLAVWRSGDAPSVISVVASHGTGGEFTIPLNLLVVDQRGRAERIRFDVENIATRIH